MAKRAHWECRDVFLRTLAVRRRGFSFDGLPAVRKSAACMAAWEPQRVN